MNRTDRYPPTVRKFEKSKETFFLGRHPVTDMGVYIGAIVGIVWLITQGTDRTGYHWQWYRVPAHLMVITEEGLKVGLLLKGLLVTLQITAMSMILALSFGLLTAYLRLSGSFLGKILARFYLETVRNTPLLVQLFFVYFVLSPILDIGRFSSAVLALSLFEGAYASEIFRAGIVSIHKGQWQASYSLGLKPLQAYRYVILPQAVRRVLPPLTSQAVSLIKDSSLVSTIALYDLTLQGQSIISETFLTFEIWFTVAGIYLMITVPISFFINVMEKNLRLET